MESERKLYLAFHGRVIDHLGIQMYQNTVDAVGEMVANAWDADAESVQVGLPGELANDAEIVVSDDGSGMTFGECQERFLNVGYGRRGDKATENSPNKERLVLGRKGIGKFAGFGVARTMEIETVSALTGERTIFRLEIDALRGADQTYVNYEPLEIQVLLHEAPDEVRKTEHGTVVRLKDLNLHRRPSAAKLSKGLARRFLILERVDDFKVEVDGTPINHREDAEKVQFDFPTDYRAGEAPGGLIVEDGWGIEELAGRQSVRWRVVFYEDTISDDDLAGVAVFAHGKMAQKPFLFNIVGGVGGQAGIPYLSGRVEADFVDELTEDLIATERQRMNWAAEETKELLGWGQLRVKQLLEIWKDRRGEAKEAVLREKVGPFAARIGKLERHERKVVESALRNVARIPSITTEQFVELGESMLIAWEKGRLRELITEVSDAQDFDEGRLLELLVEAQVLTSLHAAEAVRAKLEVVESLRKRVNGRELENSLRDFVADHPWLLSPIWDTYVVETKVNRLIRDAADAAGVETDPEWKGRVDLVLSSGRDLLVVEFMRPQVTIDMDHVQRFERYMSEIRAAMVPGASTDFDRVNGLLVADGLNQRPAVRTLVEEQRGLGRMIMDWSYLLERAEAQWRDYLFLLRDRSPEDDRIQSVLDGVDVKAPLVASVYQQDAGRLSPDTRMGGDDR